MPVDQNTPVPFEEWMKWRWEFIRRNPEYRNDFERSIQLRKAFDSRKGANVRYEDSNEGDEERQLCRKWTIDGDRMLDPGKGIEQVHDPSFCPAFHKKSTSSSFVNLGRMFEGWRSCVFLDEALDVPIEWKLRDPGNGRDKVLTVDENVLILKIHLDQVNSVTELKKAIWETIDYRLSRVGMNYAVENDDGKSNQVMQRRRREKINNTNFQLLLEIGDLADQGYTGEKIAALRYPNIFISEVDENELDSEEFEKLMLKQTAKIQETRRYLQRYRKLVKKGWINIRRT